MVRIRIVLSAFLAVGLAGCTKIIDCSDQLNSTIMVVVRDSITGRGAAQGVTVIVRNATVYDSVVATGSDSLQAYVGFEDHLPGGQYTVTVRKPGYAVWQQTAIVPRDACHSGPGPLIEARIQPIP